eukprot:634039_1
MAVLFVVTLLLILIKNSLAETTTESGVTPCHLCNTKYDPICCGSTTFPNSCWAKCNGISTSSCSPGCCVTTTTSGTDTTASNVRGIAAQSENKESALDAVPGYVWIGLMAMLFILFGAFFILWLRTKKLMDSMDTPRLASYMQFENDETM